HRLRPTERRRPASGRQLAPPLPGPLGGGAQGRLCRLEQCRARLRLGPVRRLQGRGLASVTALLATLLRLGLAGLWLFAGLVKLRDPAGLAVEIANYRLLPSWAPLLAASLPALEITLGLALLLGSPAWRRAAALATALLLAVFTVAVAQV